MISLALRSISKSLKLVSVSILVSISVLYFMGCAENDPAPLIDFELIISGPSALEYTIGTVNISAAATSPKVTIASAKIFVDDILIKELTGPTINTAWNSKTVADGTHTIKVTAIDTNGQQSTDELDIEVLNTLFILNIPANYVHDGQNKIFFFSNQKGEILAVAAPENDSQLVIETPIAFKPGDEIVFSIFYQGEAIDYINSYAEFKPGTYNLKKPIHYSETGIGSHQITVTNLPSPSTYWQISSNMISTATDLIGGGKTETTIDAPIASNGADVFVWHHVDGQLGYGGLIKNVNTGETTTVSLNTFTPMVRYTTNTVPGATLSLSAIEGLVDPDNDYSFVRVSVDVAIIETAGDTEHFRMTIPEGLFQKYVFDNVYRVDGVAYRFLEIGSTPPTTFTPLDATLEDINQENSILTSSTTGICDFTILYASKLTTGKRTSVWEFYVPSGENYAVHIPPIPSEIKAITNAEFEPLIFTRGNLMEYTTLDDYQAFLQFQFNRPDKLFLPFKMKGG